jgi:P27 family predicted phage terminase small subunit
MTKQEDSSANAKATSVINAPQPGADGSLETIVECPVELNEVARRLWDRLVGFLARTGVLKPVDQVPLAIFCQAWAGWLEAHQGIEKFGQVMNSPSGYPVQSPFVSIAKNHADTMIKVAQQYGFTAQPRADLDGGRGTGCRATRPRRAGSTKL